ncbi:hypothetical protein H2202_008032 [Exophiala xenobiotica]|nr:hypothetical protein H2202_008032 [Exophiala xenobiotica]
MTFPDPTQSRQKNVFVLCFDGTGNKFSGTDADSNILKLYRMLDRNDATMYTFYQPGIGTYITTHSLQTTSLPGRIHSWCLKAKDSAVGSSFADHVMGGYKFLMRYYSCEDDLYFFGFSRGAYTARFLAEMLDHIGLLSAGNEELIRFAWKTYAKWASRRNDGSKKAKEDEANQYAFMRGFRETFSRPVRRIRFLGLFDTVNSVPRFETAWMQRNKFPYTARSSAKIIRHAVSIDERRAKFRQDLIGEAKPRAADKTAPAIHRYGSDFPDMKEKVQDDGHQMNASAEIAPSPEPSINISDVTHAGPIRAERTDAHSFRHGRYLSIPFQTGPPSSAESLGIPVQTPSTENLPAGEGCTQAGTKQLRRKWSETTRSQDIQEVWFAGGHADIGGGWEKANGEKWMLSHAPLVWMVHEAEKAGLPLDPVYDHQSLVLLVTDLAQQSGSTVLHPAQGEQFW